MPSGIIMQSSSIGATQEAIEKVLTENGYEAEKPAAATETAAPAEPKREDFDTDEAFEKAQEDFEAIEDAEEEKREAADVEKEKQRLEALPKKTRRQKAVEKATRELQEENRKLKEALEGKGKKSPEPEIKAEALKAPKREDFSTDEEFEEAKFQFRYKSERIREQEEERKNSLNARLTKNYTDYQSSVAAFKKAHDDWDEVVSQKINIPESVYYAVVDLADEGPAVTYYLGKHPAVISELAEMTPYRAAIEIGRIADKLKTGGDQKNTTEKAPKITPKRIPDPVRPVSTSATTSTLTSRDAAQQRNFRAFKAAQRRGA